MRRALAILALAAAIAVGAAVTVPLLEVPFTLQTLFVLLAGFLLGSGGGALAAALYLVAGALGLPIFTGGAAGFGRLLGPTGGFLISFVPMAAIAGIAVRERGQRLDWRRGLVWGALATAATLAIGLAWLALSRGLAVSEVAATGLALLPGAAIKLALAVLLGRWAGRWAGGWARAGVSSR